MNGADKKFTKIGRIVRPKGLHGEVKILLSFKNPDLLSKHSVVYLKNFRGDFFPARITTVRPEKPIQSESFFVQFEHITDRADAEHIVDNGVFADKQPNELMANKSESSGQDYADYSVFDDTNSEIGYVTDVLYTAAHPVLVIQKDSGQLMIPAVDEFIEKTDHKSRIVYCKNLDQFDGI